MQFFTDVMRGEVKDAFGLDASLSDRITAGKEIMKRHAAAGEIEDTEDASAYFEAAGLSNAEK